MSKLIQAGCESDVPSTPPQIEDVGKFFVEWAEKYWGLEEAYTLVDKSKGPNTESAPWSYIRSIFIRELNEMVDRKKPTHYPLEYYKLEIREKPIKS